MCFNKLVSDLRNHVHKKEASLEKKKLEPTEVKLLVVYLW
jgi:hypothetical protein